MTDSAIPIVDIAPFRRDGDARVVADVAAAARDIGFFVVTGHGVSSAATDRIYRAARAFFDLPDAYKRTLVGTREFLGGVGFAPMGAEALAATQGMAAPGDIKESLNFGPLLPGSVWPSASALTFRRFLMEASCTRRSAAWGAATCSPASFWPTRFCGSGKPCSALSNA